MLYLLTQLLLLGCIPKRLKVTLKLKLSLEELGDFVDDRILGPLVGQRLVLAVAELALLLACCLVISDQLAEHLVIEGSP